MSEGEVAVLIVAIIFAFVSFSTYLSYRSKALRYSVDSMEKSLAEENEKLLSKTSELERRIQVLESIVTSKDFKLSEEIEALK
ncbi:MAG: hypothetical protein MI746_08910 [Pseudomonadales bacterium]|nr:hypothetical protein [Pseudomonadales bacterium]